MDDSTNSSGFAEPTTQWVSELARRHESPRAHLAEKVWQALVVVALTATPLSVSRARQTGWLPVYGLHLALAALTLGLFAMRRRLPRRITHGAIVAIVGVVGVAGLVTFGLMGVGIWGLVMATLLTNALFNVQAARVATAAMTIAIGLVGVAFATEMLALPFDSQGYMQSLTPWIIASITTAMVPLFVFQSIVSYQRTTETVLGEVQHQAIVIRDQHRALEQFKRDVQTEHALASLVFKRMIHRRAGADRRLRVSLSSLSVFNGDAVFAAVTPSGNLRVLIADVSGHGLTASLGTLALCSLFYSSAERGDDLLTSLELMNRELALTLPANLFAGVVAIDLSRSRGEMRVFNAGMPPVYIHRHRSLDEIISTNVPLGITKSYSPRVESFMVSQNDRLFAMSDGIIERANAAGELFGIERVKRLFEVSSGENAFDSLLAAVAQYDPDQRDDVTLVELVV